MARISRPYYRSEGKKRDYHLFAIACEGSVREREYFASFQHLSSRIAVRLINDVDDSGNEIISTNSSPAHIIRRAERFCENVGLIEGDELWLVLDVDRWGDRQLSELCAEGHRRGWNVAISNPCFEVWLCYHKENEIDDGGFERSSAWFKAHLATLTPGGYSSTQYAPLAFETAGRLAKMDANPETRIPAYKFTHVHRLFLELEKFASASDLQAFGTI